MSRIGPHRKFGLLQLTVIEYFTDMDTIHVHCKLQMNLENLAHPRLLAKHLIANCPILKNKAHRLYYVVPPFRTIISLDDNVVSAEVFLEWFHRNAYSAYAVIVDRTPSSDFKKVVKLYWNQTSTVDVDRAKDFKTVAKPFSHRPMEPEIDWTGSPIL